MWPPDHLELVPPAKPRKRRAQPEANLQRAVVQYLELALPPEAGVWWSSTLNGVRLTTPKARKDAKAQGLRPGLYDFVFIPLRGPDAGQGFFLELKSDDGRLTPEQTTLMNVLWPAGRGASARSVEQVCAALVAFGFPLRCRV